MNDSSQFPSVASVVGDGHIITSPRAVDGIVYSPRITVPTANY